MGAKLLSPGHVSSWITSYDEEDTSEELIQIYKDSNPDAKKKKKHLLFDKNTITNIPSQITEAIENIDIESYKIWDDDNEPPAAPDAQPLDVIDMENDFEKRHKDGLIPTYCTYCTRYKRIKTANDVKRGDSIRLPRLKGIYYHHAIVKEVLKDNENPTCCSLTLIHLQKSDDSLKPAKTKVKEETIDYNFKQTVLEK
ncbi:unnamed protein product [Mytilus edulis]|uniref:Uncharacterized protein n=1 Tax=Mytilus edulis TaxID=6550 RepID=A0A8S3SQW8_MYTED|nr:unnamed protein product [Mytilus edulis]